MAVQLYTKGASSARTLISDGKYDDKSPWSFSAEDGNALLGDAGDDWTNFGKFHLGEDTSAAANTKGRFKYPHGKDGKVYGGALRAIRSRASQQDEKAIYDKAGELLDLIKTKEGTDGRQALRAQSFPAYDPDGDGDNDAQEAHGSVVAAGHLLDTAAGALSGAPGDSTTQAISRTLAAKGPRRGARAEALPDYDPDGDGDNDAEEALTHVRAAGTLLDYADDSLTGSPTDPETKACVRALLRGLRERDPRAAHPGVVLPFKAPAGKSVLRVHALAGSDTVEMDLFGVVGGDFWGDGGITKEQFAEELRQIPAKAARVEMRLSSPGGDVFDGRAIANMMKDHPCAFDVNIVAEASSVASIIAMAGDTVRMGEGAVMLIHRCYSFVMGNSLELTKIAADLAVIDETMVQTYCRRTGMKAKDVLALMDENRYMSSEEAKSRGFVDTIATTTVASGVLRIAAMNIDRSRFHLPPLPQSLQPRRAAALAAIGRLRAEVAKAR
jgi:ATP-dependent protease ClpP protease subunit